MFERRVNNGNVSHANIVVGLAYDNEADSISYPTQQFGLGLRKFYPDMKKGAY